VLSGIERSDHVIRVDPPVADNAGVVALDCGDQ